MEIALEIGLKLPGRPITPRWFTLDCLLDDRHQIARDGAIDAVQAGRLPPTDLLDELVAIPAVEGRSQGRELIQRQAQRVHVAAWIGMPFKGFRRHVAERA